LLVACKTARFHGDSLRVHDELTVSTKKLWVREPVASFSGQVTRADALLAEVELTVIATDDAVAAMKAFREG
jgi:hypothetical protein